MLDFYARPDVPPVETILANLSDSEFYDTDIETEIPKKKKSGEKLFRYSISFDKQYFILTFC